MIKATKRNVKIKAPAIEALTEAAAILECLYSHCIEDNAYPDGEKNPDVFFAEMRNLFNQILEGEKND